MYENDYGSRDEKGHYILNKQIIKNPRATKEKLKMRRVKFLVKEKVNKNILKNLINRFIFFSNIDLCLLL